jgi:ADP-ribose pyrophosphatase YjhB (NUDIX family)
MAKTPVQVVSVAAFDSQGRLLMGKRRDCGKWTCPGGHMEPGEKPARAAVRELLEETGLRPGSGGLESLGSKILKDGELEVHSFKTTGVKGKATGEDDPDEECRVWKWLDVEDGLPEEQEQNLYNAQDVTLQLLGFQDGPVRKFQIPPPVGERLAKAGLPKTEVPPPTAAHHVLWDQLQQEGWHRREITSGPLFNRTGKPDTLQLLNPKFFNERGESVGPQPGHGELQYVMTHGPGAKDWKGQPSFYTYRVGQTQDPKQLPYATVDHRDFNPVSRYAFEPKVQAEPAPAPVPSLKKTEVDQAQERLRATNLTLLSPALWALNQLARNSDFHIGEMRAQADATRAALQRQVQERTQAVQPGPTPRELAILETQSPAAQLLALQSPAATRADRELVLQLIASHSLNGEEDSDPLFRHLNQTLDQDQRLWLASQVGVNGRARWVMGKMMGLDQSRWKLPERAVVAEQALQLMQRPNASEQMRGTSLRDMVVSEHAPTPLPPEQIQGFLEAAHVTGAQYQQLAAHPDIPQAFLQEQVHKAVEMQKARHQLMDDGLDFPADPHAEADAYLMNPQVPDQVVRDYARREIQNFLPDYGLPASLTRMPQHRPEMVDQLAPELYQSAWEDTEHPAFSGSPGGILRDAYIRAPQGYATRPIPPAVQQEIAKRGIHPQASDLPEFARQALGRPDFSPELREQLLTPERIQSAAEPRNYIPAVMGAGLPEVLENAPDHDQWLQKMQLHPDARVSDFALRNADAINPGLADIIRNDPGDQGQDLISSIQVRPKRPVPESVVKAMADVVPQSRAAQTALLVLAQNQNPGVKAEHLQPLLDLQELGLDGQPWTAGMPLTKDTVLRHEALSLPQITGDQLHRAITGPDAHRWAGRLGAKSSEWAEDDRPGIEQALELHGHKLSREQQIQLVDNPLIHVAYHAARNLHPDDITPVLNRSHRFATLQGLLSNRAITPEHLHEIASRPGLASMLTIAAKEPHASPETLNQVYDYRNRILAQGGEMDDLIRSLVKHKNASPELLQSLDQDLRNVLTHGAGPDSDPWTRQLHDQAVLRGPQLLKGLMENPRMPFDRAVDLGEWVQNLHPATMPEDWETRPPPHPAFKRQWEFSFPQTPEGQAEAALHALPGYPQKQQAWMRYMDRGKNPDWQELTKLATRLVSEMHPDSRFKTRTRIRPGTERLREIRDLILDRNPEQGQLSPKHLPPGDWSVGRLPNGNISAEKLQAHMDSLPGQEYNLSNTHWASPLQRHNAFPSKVLQVNLTTDQVQKLKHAGVWPTFRKMAEASRSSSHPVNDHTLGWVRFTGTPQHGFFIDEIQSDFGQSFVKYARQFAQARGHDPEQAAKRAEEQYPEEHYQKIREIVFGNRHPNQILHEVFLQHLRDQGHVGVPVHMHTPQTKAPISGMKSKALPAHMLETYGEQPRKMGYRPVTYGSIAATSSRGPPWRSRSTSPTLRGAPTPARLPSSPSPTPMSWSAGGGLGTSRVNYKPHDSLPGATIQGTKIRKFEDQARLWLLTRAMPLAKMAISPKDLRTVGKATNASLGQAQVDDSQEHMAHPPLMTMWPRPSAPRSWTAPRRSSARPSASRRAATLAPRRSSISLGFTWRDWAAITASWSSPTTR